MALFAALTANGAGLILVEDTRWWPGPFPPPRPPTHPIWPPRPVPHEPAPPRFLFAPLETTELNVEARIKDQVATTTVHQLFSNPHAARVEGTFLFPLPKGAQIDKFTMEMDGKQVEAELLPADKARRIYEDHHQETQRTPLC